MCDSVAIADAARGGWWLAKNSDREPDEPQPVEFHPAVRGDPAPALKVTHLTIPQVPDRHAVLISRPAWMWGAEMGVNERGLAIANEAVFSRRRDVRVPRLLGMDLLRLALERAASAAEALTVITKLLEEFGQGGPAGYRNRRFAYDNSFLIADAREAFILETAGREWAASRIRHGFAALSNGYRLRRDWERAGGGFPGGDFAARHERRAMRMIAAAHARRCLAEAALAEMAAGSGPSFEALAALLRLHARGDGFAGGSNRDICMHAGGGFRPWRPSATTASMIAWLAPHGPPRVAFTGAMTPCITPFRPAVFDADRIARLFPPELGEAGRRAHRRAIRDAAFRAARRRALGLIEETVFKAALAPAPEALEAAAGALARLPGADPFSPPAARAGRIREAAG